MTRERVLFSGHSRSRRVFIAPLYVSIMISKLLSCTCSKERAIVCGEWNCFLAVDHSTVMNSWCYRYQDILPKPTTSSGTENCFNCNQCSRASLVGVELGWSTSLLTVRLINHLKRLMSASVPARTPMKAQLHRLICFLSAEKRFHFNATFIKLGTMSFLLSGAMSPFIWWPLFRWKCFGI